MSFVEWWNCNEHVWHSVQNVLLSNVFITRKPQKTIENSLFACIIFPIVRKIIAQLYFFICWTFRFMSASVEHNIQTYILELVHDQLTRRQTLDSITRNLLKLLTVTCGYSQIRLLVSQRLEMWLQNPKVCICLFVCFFTLMLYAKWWFNWT